MVILKSKFMLRNNAR